MENHPQQIHPWVAKAKEDKSRPFFDSTSPSTYLVNPSTTVSTLRPVVRSHGDPHSFNSGSNTNSRASINLAQTYFNAREDHQVLEKHDSISSNQHHKQSSLIHNNPQKDGGHGPTHIPTLRVAHHGSAKQTTKLPYVVVNPTTSKPFISSTSPAKYLVNPTTTVSTLRPVLKRERPPRPEVYPIPPIPTFDPKSLPTPTPSAFSNSVNTFSTLKPAPTSKPLRIKPRPKTFLTEPPFFSETLSQIPHPNLVSPNVNLNLNLYPTNTPKPKRESKNPIPSSPSNPISKRPTQLLNPNIHPKLRSTPKPIVAETSTFKNIEDHVEDIKNIVEEAFNIKPKAKPKLKKKIRPYRPPGPASPTPRPVLIRPTPTPFTPTFKSSDRRATASPTPSPFTPVFKPSSDRRATASPTRRPPTTPFALYKAPTKTLQPYRPRPVTPKAKISYSPTIPPEPVFNRPVPVKNSVTRVNPKNYGLSQNEHPVPVEHSNAFRAHPEPNFDRQIPTVKSSVKNRPDSNYGSSQNERNPVPVSINRPVNRPQQSYSNQNDNFGRPKKFENPYSEKNLVPQIKYSDTQSYNENHGTNSGLDIRNTDIRNTEIRTNWAEPRNDILEKQDLNEITDEELLIQMAAGLELGKLK